MSICRPVLLFALSMLIAGCASSAEQQAKSDHDRCAARGHQPGSKAHDDCVSRIHSERDARMQQRHREMVERPAVPTFGR